MEFYKIQKKNTISEIDKTSLIVFSYNTIVIKIYLETNISDCIVTG